MLNKIFSFVFLIISIVYSQSNYFFQPSSYFTYGRYSDKTITNQLSFFANGSFNSNYLFVVGYDKIRLENQQWKYKQENYSLGIHYWLTDLKIKLKSDFLLLNGSYTDDINTKPLLDKGFLISPELIYGVYPFYLGTGVSFFSQTGNSKGLSNQVYLRSDYYPHYKFLSTFIFSGHIISDKLRYISLQSSLTYYLLYELSINSTFTIGTRKFYYNPDLMVLFNQLETQRGNYSIRINYNFYKNFIASFIYEKSKFTSIEIDYFVIGIKTSFYF